MSTKIDNVVYRAS